MSASVQPRPFHLLGPQGCGQQVPTWRRTRPVPLSFSAIDALSASVATAIKAASSSSMPLVEVILPEEKTKLIYDRCLLKSLG
jgi:hypothetical protein